MTQYATVDIRIFRFAGSVRSSGVLVLHLDIPADVKKQKLTYQPDNMLLSCCLVSNISKVCRCH